MDLKDLKMEHVSAGQLCWIAVEEQDSCPNAPYKTNMISRV